MTQNPRTGVFVAVAAGAFIGSLIGLQMTPMFWWAGMLVGGLTGYLTYDPLAVVQALPRAARAASDAMDGFLEELPERLLLIVSSTFFLLAMGLLACGAGAGWSVLFIWGMDWLTVKGYVESSGPGVLLYFAFPMLSMLLGVLLFMMDSIKHPKSSGQDTARRVYLLMNPITVLLYYVPKGTFWVISKTVRFLMLTVWHLFKLIHSDLRLLCGVDASIGATIGIFAHNPIIGAIAGGLIGVLDFELVSKRWLKLVPARS